MILFYLSLIMHYLKHVLRQRLYRSNNKQIFKTVIVGSSTSIPEQPKFLNSLKRARKSQNNPDQSAFLSQWCTDWRCSSYSANGKQNKGLRAETTALPHTPSKIKEFHSHLGLEGRRVCSFHALMSYLSFALSVHDLWLSNNQSKASSQFRGQNEWCQAPAWSERWRPLHCL